MQYLLLYSIILGCLDVLLGKSVNIIKGGEHKIIFEKTPNIINPQDHLDAVKIESDGHLNKDYRKEVILGNHEHFEQFSGKEQEQMLKEIFSRVDQDKDDKINQIELEEWIITKVDEHFSEAKQENEDVHKQLDSDSNGEVSWKEYLMHFLRSIGITGDEAIALAKSDMTKLKMHLSQQDNDQLLSSRFRWSEVDDNKDSVLNLEEFKNFRHPEGSKTTMSGVVKDILENLDTNHDEQLSEEEFAHLPDGELEGQVDTDQLKNTDNIWMKERRDEFKNVIDTNNDGVVTKDELLNYVDPHNPNHARNEAKHLIQLADQNHDMQLSLDEVINNKAIFMGSKMVNPARNLHNEL